MIKRNRHSAIAYGIDKKGIVANVTEFEQQQWQYHAG
jgi:hypothetical protein